MRIVIVKLPNGRFRFEVLTGSGHVVTKSDTYRHKAAALAGVAQFKAQLAAAGVEDDDTRVPSLANPVPGSLPPI